LDSLEGLNVKGFFLALNVDWNSSAFALEEMGFVGLSPYRLWVLGQKTSVL